MRGPTSARDGSGGAMSVCPSRSSACASAGERFAPAGRMNAGNSVSAARALGNTASGASGARLTISPVSAVPFSSAARRGSRPAASIAAPARPIGMA